MFDVIEARKVSREAVVDHYGEVFAWIFEESYSCIAVALSSLRDDEPRTDMSAKRNALMKESKR